MLGCTDFLYEEYDPNANVDDGSCLTPQLNGCTDSSACNYNPFAENDDASCVYVDGICETCEAGIIVDNDLDNDGICDDDEIDGCTDATACNYNENATDDDGSCTYPSENYLDCNEDCLNDTDGDGVCDEIEILGCTNELACNYNADATDDGPCTYPSEDYLDCSGDCLNDTDGDGVCDELEVSGCTNDTACNYNEDATDDDGSCTFADVGYDCDGVCLSDADGDGVCDEFEVSGCTDDTACNYSEDATDDDGSCTYQSEDYLDCNEDCLNDTDGDGVCDELEVSGCTDATACNYNSIAEIDDGSCEYPDLGYDCEGECNSDTDGDGICDGSDICPDDPDNDADGDGICDNLDSCPGDPVNDPDGDGVCDIDEVYGCTDSTACNYNFIATEEDASCIYAIGCDYCSGEVDGTGVVIDGDVDADGVCDYNEIFGCNDELACNYNENATEDDGSCEYPIVWYFDGDGDGDGNSNDGEIISCDQPDGYVPNNNENVSFADGYGSCCRGDNIALEEDSPFDFDIYPNPARSFLYVDYESNYVSDITVRIFNAIGEIMLDKQYNGSNYFNLQLDVSSYSKGMYQINLISKEHYLNKMILVQ